MFRGRLSQNNPKAVQQTGKLKDERRAMCDAIAMLMKRTRKLLITQTIPHIDHEAASYLWHHTLKHDPILSKRVSVEASSQAKICYQQVFTEGILFVVETRS